MLSGLSKKVKTGSPAAERFQQVREMTDLLVSAITPEDAVLQSMPDASPTKWHLAHTTWFFEQFVLTFDSSYRPYHPTYSYLFNSYYQKAGTLYPRESRGLISRPTLSEILDYRYHVDTAVRCLLDDISPEMEPELYRRLEIGEMHEQQHQELILMDIQHLLFQNPLRPGLFPEAPEPNKPRILAWVPFERGLYEVGAKPGAFSYDNEGPCHAVFIDHFSVASRLSTNAEYMEFIRDDGYHRPELWLSDGWDIKNREGWEAPLYWKKSGGDFRIFTLAGEQSIDPHEPVSHVSYYEAEAFARWSYARLLTEFEWEVASQEASQKGNFLESRKFRPANCSSNDYRVHQMFGDLWEWTQSPYTPYPGYRPWKGILGEYNGKFMCNQYVLKGGSYATPESHIRASYRNFYPPHARWQFVGIRLAKEPLC
jgi:ergothioneine biosynthesis protein EgtB